MKSILIFLTLLLSTFSFGQSPYQIKNIKAFLYYNESKTLDKENSAGTLSENIVDNKEFHFWNTIIGEGSAKGISNQTLVVVEVNGTPKGFFERKLRLTVKSNDKIVYQKTDDFFIMDEKTKYFIPFLVYKTGCSKLNLTAEILNNQIVESVLIKSINFECGE